MSTSDEAVRLSVVLLQYEVEGKYPQALPRLLAVLDRLRSVEVSLVLVDNGREGDWEHRVSENILQVGGDNRAWEFSGFDRGLEALDRWRPGADLVVLVTDAFQAYGDGVLELIDERVVECALRLRACIGWMDSFGLQQCRIGNLTYDTWLRSSFVFLPAESLASVRPLSGDLESLDLFGDSPEAPFSDAAEISENLRELLLEWLTTLEPERSRLAERWHSRFELSAETLPLFRAKVCSILREHLLSARLREAGVACYDYRCLPLLAKQGRLDSFLDQGGSPELEWLGWRSLSPEWTATSDGAEKSFEPERAQLSLLLAGEIGTSQSPEAALFLAERVLPLVRQRYAGVRLLVAGNSSHLEGTAFSETESVLLRPVLSELLGSDLLDSCAAVVAPPGSDPACLRASQFLIANRLPLVASRKALAADPRVCGGSLPADSPAEIAAACCRLIEEKRAVTDA